VKKKITILAFILYLCVGVSQWAWAEEPQIVGETAALIDGKTGTLLYGKEEHKRMYPASTTKILTALVALERSKLTDVVSIGPNAVTAGGTHIGLTEGERLTMEDLLYALLLNSSNDAGVAIAEHIAGSVEKFATVSNQKAKEIGARDTHFTNPHGMPDDNHYSTAYDLALIARRAMENKEFRKIVSTVQREITRADPQAQKYLFNHNKLLWSKYFGYRGATGVKTGYTVEAGQCIVASAERDGRELIAVVLHSEGSSLWSDAAKLLDYGFTNFYNRQLVYAGRVMASKTVRYGKGNVDLVARQDFFYTFPAQGAEDVQISVQPQKEIKAPVVKGQVLGAVVISRDGKELGKVDLVAARDVGRAWLSLLKPALYWAIPPMLVLLWFRRNQRLKWLKRKRVYRRRQYYDGYEE